MLTSQSDRSPSVVAAPNPRSHNLSDPHSAKRIKREASSNDRPVATKPSVTASPANKQKASAEPPLSNEDRLRREIAEQERHVEFLRARHANLAQRKRG